MHKSTKLLIIIIAITFLIPILSLVLPAAGSDESVPHKVYFALHILGVVLFLGNIIITGLWMFIAEKSKTISVMQFAAKAVNWMDVFFTAPGVAMLLLGGLMLAPSHGGLYSKSWITVGLILFSLSGIVWLLFLVPNQHRMITLSENNMVKNGKLPNEFFKVLYRWYFWGIVATILPLITFVIMIFKPKFW